MVIVHALSDRERVIDHHLLIEVTCQEGHFIFSSRTNVFFVSHVPTQTRRKGDALACNLDQ